MDCSERPRIYDEENHLSKMTVNKLIQFLYCLQNEADKKFQLADQHEISDKKVSEIYYKQAEALEAQLDKIAEVLSIIGIEFAFNPGTISDNTIYKYFKVNGKRQKISRHKLNV